MLFRQGALYFDCEAQYLPGVSGIGVLMAYVSPMPETDGAAWHVKVPLVWVALVKGSMVCIG